MLTNSESSEVIDENELSSKKEFWEQYGLDLIPEDEILSEHHEETNDEDNKEE